MGGKESVVSRSPPPLCLGSKRCPGEGVVGFGDVRLLATVSKPASCRGSGTPSCARVVEARSRDRSKSGWLDAFR